MTDEGRQALPADPEASLRETLRATIEDAQAKLIANLAQLRSSANADTRLIAQGDGELGQLAALQSQLQTASPAALAMIGALIAASAANAATLAQRVSDAVTTAQSEAASQQLAVADKAARSAVTSFEKDFYERKIFDDFLDFKSDEDKKAYREREEERKRAIDRERAKGTPEGDLQALNLSIAQMEDAGAHGADRSPAYQPKLDEMRSARAQLARQLPNQDKATDPQANAVAMGDTKNVAASTTVSPDLIASFRATGTAIADQDAEGHGVPARDPASVKRGLG